MKLTALLTAAIALTTCSPVLSQSLVNQYLNETKSDIAPVWRDLPASMRTDKYLVAGAEQYCSAMNWGMTPTRLVDIIYESSLKGRTERTRFVYSVFALTQLYNGSQFLCPHHYPSVDAEFDP